MTKFMDKSFSTYAPGDDSYRENWEATFGKRDPVSGEVGCVVEKMKEEFSATPNASPAFSEDEECSVCGAVTDGERAHCDHGGPAPTPSPAPQRNAIPCTCRDPRNAHVSTRQEATRYGWASATADRVDEVAEALAPWTMTGNCEHGDHPAPEDARFCSEACERCEHESANDETGCDNICGRASTRSSGKEKGPETIGPESDDPADSRDYGKLACGCDFLQGCLCYTRR